MRDTFTGEGPGFEVGDEERWYDFLRSQDNDTSEQVPISPGDPGSSGGSGSEGYLADEPSDPAQNGGETSGSGTGALKPVGFVNYGEFDAVVMPYTFVPLGGSSQVQPDQASTVSSADDGSGDWPNSSRFLILPMGTYSWCVDWEEGDLDEDGQIDYFHYIHNAPTLLDESDNDDLIFAEEVAISAPPSTAPIYTGKCTSPPLDSCAGKSQHVMVYSSPGWINGTDMQTEIIAYANTGEYPPTTEGIKISNGGGYSLQRAWILYQAGDYLEVSFDGLYSAVGVQPHGESIIGWARVLFDGEEVWRGDTSSYWHDGDGYLHAVYVEVRCFPPGLHTLRIECLGQEGSGGAKGSGGQTDVPISHFGFRR
jgi:hypothetical protein